MSGLRLAAALALCACLAGCGGESAVPFDLSAATPGPHRVVKAQIRVRASTTTDDLDSERVLVRTGPNALAQLAGAQWSDRLPDLLQARLVETFQRAGVPRVVGESANSDYDLTSDLRVFELDAEQKQVHVEIAVKLVSTRGGRVVATRVFKASEPVASTGAQVVMQALDHTSSDVMAQIVEFVAAKL